MDEIRAAFEKDTAQSFMGDRHFECIYNYETGTKTWSRDAAGTYCNPVIEDHWQTFQEGWEAAVTFLKNKTVSAASDVYTGGKISDGGYDVR